MNAIEPDGNNPAGLCRGGCASRGARWAAGGAAVLLALLTPLAAWGRPAGAVHDTFPQWSPDGQSIVFTSTRDGDPELYRIGADGSGLARLTHSPGRDAHPAYSPDGRRIVFQSPRANGVDTNIYVMDADGANVAPLTALKGFAGVPVFSPDGARIAFQWREAAEGMEEGRAPKWRLCVVNSDGSGFRALTTGEANDQVANWSPDGTQLAFFSDRSGRNQIYLMKPDGGGVRRVAETLSNDFAPFWSPDGRRIAFTSDRAGGGDVYVMDTSGQGVRRLTETAAAERTSVWSPDGRTILTCSESEDGSVLLLVPAEGQGAATRIVPVAGAEATAAGALLALHAKVLRAHLARDAELLLADETEDYVVGNRGAITRPSIAQRRERLGGYLGRTRFSEYRDLVAPVVEVSPDGRLGWVIVQVTARGEQVQEDGSTSGVEFTSAWIELYRLVDGAWKRVGNLSNFQPEPAP